MTGQLEDCEADDDTTAENSRKTSFFEMLEFCHDMTSQAFTTRSSPDNTDAAITSRPAAPLTVPGDFYVPHRLQQWRDFSLVQDKTFVALMRLLIEGGSALMFASRNHLRRYGSPCSPVSSECDVHLVHRKLIESPMLDALKVIRSSCPPDTELFRHLGDDVFFDTGPCQSPQIAAGPRRAIFCEFAARNDADSSPATTSPAATTAPKPIVIVEFKAPCQISYNDLISGLILTEQSKPHRFHEPIILESTSGRNSRLLVSGILAQMFTYMVTTGTPFGYLSTLESMVFFKLEWQKNQAVLYYHVPHPEKESPSECVVRYSAMTQLLLFVLSCSRDSLAISSRKLTANALLVMLHKWESPTVSFGKNGRKKRRASEVLISPRTAPLLPPRSEDFVKSDSSIPPSPSSLPLSRSKVSYAGVIEPKPIPDPILKAAAVLKPKYELPMQFCTTKCLLGLVRGLDLDPECPNLFSHVMPTGTTEEVPLSGKKHLISASDICPLIYEQARQQPRGGFTYTGQKGNRGTIFQVTIEKYGYTMIAKNFTAHSSETKHTLDHEEIIYRQMEALQGVCIPVLLGRISYLHNNDIYMFGEKRRMFMDGILLSHAGKSFEELGEGIGLTDSDKDILRGQALDALAMIHSLGITHQSMYIRNLTVDSSTKRVCIIDLERCIIQPSNPMTLTQRKGEPAYSNFVWSDVEDRILIYTQQNAQHYRYSQTWGELLDKDFHKVWWLWREGSISRPSRPKREEQKL